MPKVAKTTSRKSMAKDSKIPSQTSFKSESSSLTDINAESVKIKVDDNLNLRQMAIPKLPTDLMFPQELNKYLREQIQALNHENEMLKQVVTEKDNQLVSMNNKVEVLENKVKQYEHFTKNTSISMQGTHADLASSKIVELSKKIRELSSEVESYKTKCSKLENKIKAMPKEEDLKLNTPVEEQKRDESPDQIKSLTEKLAAVTKKLFETKNRNIELTNELKTANRLLSQEVGDSFTTIQNLAGAGSSWRGRAQQIISLQNKLSEYQEKLSTTPLMEKDSVTTLSIRQAESNRRQVQEQISKELILTKSQYEEVKKKLDGSRARIRVLENELFTLRAKVTTLLEKSDHDNQLVKALTGQITALEDKHKESLSEKRTTHEKLIEANKALKMDLEKEKERQESLQKLLNDREEKLEEIKNQLKEFSNTMPYIGETQKHYEEKRIDSSCSEGFEKVLSKIGDSEKFRLLELIAALNSRLEVARNAFDESQMSFKKECQKVIRLENKIAKLEIEKTMSRTSLYSRMSKHVSVDSKNSNALIENEEMKNKVELLNEELLLLRNRLRTLEDEKLMDLENFQLTLENTKKIFYDELKRVKQSEEKS